MSPQNQSLKNSHPNLYLGILAWGMWGVFMGVSLVSLSKWLGGTFTLIFGLCYIITGSMKLIGLNNLSLARKGMIGCIMLSFFAGFSSITAAISIFDTDPVMAGLLIILGITIIFYGSITQFAPLQEPSINPLTMKQDRDDD